MKFVGQYDFDEKIKLFLNNFSPDNEYVIWGCGNAFNILINDIGSKLKIKYCVDTNAKLHGTVLYGNKVFSPDHLFNDDKNNIKVLITPWGYTWKSIYNTLIDNGLNETSFCFAFDWLSLFKYYYQNILSLQEIAIACTTVCTLNCNGCLVYLPYHNHLKHFDFNRIITDIDQYFSIVDFANVVTLGTGEVLLHPKIGDILNYIYEKYNGRYGHLLVITNATHIPKPETMETLQRVDCHVKISEYEHLEGHGIIGGVIDSFERHKINYHTEKSFGTETEVGGLWSDIGIPSSSHGKTEEAKKYVFENCSACCKFLYDSKIFYCPPQCGATIGELYNPLDNDCIDLAKPVTKIDVLKYYLGVQPSGYIPFCDRCDGLGIIANPNTIPAGEQLKRENK